MKTAKDLEKEDATAALRLRDKTGDESLPAIEMEDDNEYGSRLTYKLTSIPPIAIIVFTAIQHILLCIPGSLFMSSAISDVMCIPYTHPARATLFCSTIFMAGFCTIIQVAFGVRLPILQGPAGSFLVPLLALKSRDGWQCSEEDLKSQAQSLVVNGTWNSTISTDILADTDEAIYNKLQQVSGALMLASLLETMMGGLGLIGLILRFIGPITVAVTITLIGISIIPLPIEFAKASYPLGIACLALILIFILYFQNVRVPIPRCGKARKERGRISMVPVFQFIPILIGLLIMWFISWLLTIFGAFTDDKTSIEYFARTDAKLDVIGLSPLFQLSYPGMWGVPKMNVALAVGFMFSATASMVESVGDYYATQHASEVHRPPTYAISRGILLEGLGTLMSGAVGVGHATTSYSANIGVLILSKNASRSVMYAAGFILIILSLFAKAGAVVTGIPSPVLGGVGMLIVGTLVCIGLSNLRNVDMTCTRNLMVVGIPIVCGIGVPMCVEKNPGILDTGIDQVTQLLSIVLGSPMFLGGILATILDNTVAGSLAIRGMAPSQEQHDTHAQTQEGDENNNDNSYSWSWYPKLVKALPFLSYLPFMPPNPAKSGSFSPIDTESLELTKNGVV